MILVVNANTNECRIYLYDKAAAKLTLIKELHHPDSKLRNGELTADREGHYRAGNHARGAYSPHTDAREVEISNFSREIADDLNHRRHANGFEKLILIVSPSMCGILSQHLDKHVMSLVSNHIQKDLIEMKEHELLNFLQQHTKYPD